MDPRDVNRINYNNYYVGQNLDFLVRSKMRSESLSTPLKNTPAFYDDQVNTKMSLLGKRGYYDPSYIYGFSNQEQDNEINQNEVDKYNKKNNEEYANPILTKEQYEQIILPKEHYREQLMTENENNNFPKYLNQGNSNLNNIRNNNIDNNINNNINNRNKYNDEMLYREKLASYLKERQTPQKLDNFQLERINQNNNIENEPKNLNIPKEHPNNLNNNFEERRKEEEPKNINDFNDPEREYYEQIRLNNNGMVRNQDKIPNQDYYKQISEYNYINELAKKNTGNMALPLTRNQILQEVLTENFNKKHFSNK